MIYLNPHPGDPPAVGLAHGPHASDFLDRWLGKVDYVETTFEQLRHDSSAALLQERVPFILHCASMSVAGCVRPDETTLAQIEQQAIRTGTPWIGEHLAFVLAHPLDETTLAEVEQQTARTGTPWIGDRLSFILAHPAHEVLDDKSGVPTQLTYTICPQLSSQTLECTLNNFRFLQSRFSKPIILENPPQYFTVPGSEMSLVDFMVELFDHCGAGLLMDLTHFLIAAKNMGFDAQREIERLPLERVVEVHLSGIGTQSGLTWDDHSNPAPELVFQLLRQIRRRARPRAITLEYNWAPDFSDDIVLDHLDRVRTITSGMAVGSR
jgi:uncharacterized protein